METMSDVYDLAYPSPVSLQEISSIVVAVDLWHNEICSRLERNKRSHELRLKKNIALKIAIPNLPSVIYNLLEKYVQTSRKSILSWQEYHYCNVFKRSGWTNMLSRFHDFAWDWDGTIHEERTAKRMMMCDRLTKVEKFKIACLYCFEDDIKQIWPSVSEMKELNKINFRTCPEQYYWICYLRNELRKIPNPLKYPIDLLMIITCRSRELQCEWRNRSSIVYFWTRLPSDCQPSPYNIYFDISWRILFVRFVLPKLSEYQLDTFVAENGSNIMRSLFLYGALRAYVLPTWMYIRSRIDLTNFRNLINRLLEGESSSCGLYLRSEYAANLFREIWNSAPQHFKRSVLDDVLYRDDRLPRAKTIRHWNNSGTTSLMTVLRDAAFEERNAFWLKNWQNFIFYAFVEDLVVMMKLCFRNENEITLFKENVMSIYENIYEGCASLLACGLFIALNGVLSVCCLDERKIKEFKVRLLRSNYVGDNSVLTVNVIRNNKLLKEFIDDAFQDAADLGVEFRNQLRSSPVTQNCLLECIRKGWFIVLIEFVDSFFPDEQVIVGCLKKRFFQYFKEQLIAGSILNMHSGNMQVFLVWLLGSEDEVIGFKQSIQVEDIFRTMMPDYEWRINYYLKPTFPWDVERFLMWYFNNDEEEIDKFTKLNVDVRVVKPRATRKRRRIV